MGFFSGLDMYVCKCQALPAQNSLRMSGVTHPQQAYATQSKLMPPTASLCHRRLGNNLKLLHNFFSNNTI